MATGRIVTKPFRIPEHPPEIEAALGQLAPAVQEAFPGLPKARWVALQLLNGDGRVEEAVRTGEIGSLSANESAPAIPAAMPAAAAWRAILDRAGSLRWRLSPEFDDALMGSIYRAARGIAERSTATGLRRAKFDLDRTLDRVLTSRWLGFPLMLLVLAVVFWITITGANVPSRFLASVLIGKVHPVLQAFGAGIGMPGWLSGVLFDGMYLATAWVVSVMLPPMAIFFPLFTLLEDFGYLPRVAFNLDGMFRRVGAH
ncbi:MAG: ferrous iron transporter B, partial [Gemmatimonadetes bacterium]|nr:ferrous iron transporter B [Gemmatimonadota bacterium]